MRLFTLASFALLTIGMSSFAASTKFYLYVGSYTKEIRAYEFDSSNGQLKPLGPAGQVDSPSWITADPQQRYVFAVSEVDGKEGGVAAFAINHEDGSLRKLNELPSGGVAPCNATTDRTGKMLLAANYMTGGVSGYRIHDDGSLAGMSTLMTAVGHGPNKQRQDGPHAHEVVITSDNKFLYVPDLGLDEIRMYHLDPAKGTLGPADPPFVKQNAGYGPRHIAFSPDEQYAYVINELKSVVSVFKHDKATGSLTKIEDVSTLPPDYSGENGPAEILVDASGKFVYGTNRGADTIAVFAVEPGKGTLRLIQSVSSQGQMPRGLTIDPTGKYMFVGNQKTNNFAIYRIDPASGQLTATGQVIEQGTPVAFLFIPR